MAKLMGVKLILISIAIFLALWNYFWRDAINIPFLSNLSTLTVYIIAGAALLLDIIVNISTSKK